MPAGVDKGPRHGGCPLFPCGASEHAVTPCFYSPPPLLLCLDRPKPLYKYFYLPPRGKRGEGGGIKKKGHMVGGGSTESWDLDRGGGWGRLSINHGNTYTDLGKFKGLPGEIEQG